ncbi:acid protease [Aulographum hederae CBS 113979]|uniref:Acid protease n=1 Tax=Aulographum hederae CBS 113979 TaxID=1176131 RepID=A0A6G1GJI8_9PEZI|nr:acid protease [Aulographum hederae CBS 113979]
MYLLLLAVLLPWTTLCAEVAIPLKRKTLLMRWSKWSTEYDDSITANPKSMWQRRPLPGLHPRQGTNQLPFFGQREQKDHDGLVQAQDNDDYYHFLFLTEITIGTPPQHFLANVDINWSDVFVPSSDCTLDPDVGKLCIPRRKYNASASSTYAANGRPTALFYFWIDTKGKISQDLLEVGGLEVSGQQFEEATFWETLYPTWWSPQESAFGLARLSPQHFKTIHANSPLQNLVGRNMLDKNVFTLELPQTDETPGELVLGGYNESKLGPNSLTLPISHQMDGHNRGILFLASCGWQVNISSLTFDAPEWQDQPLNIDLEGYTAIISNSIDYISFPFSKMKPMEDYLRLDQREDLDCSWRTNLPNLTVSFGDHGDITLTPTQYLSWVENEKDEVRCEFPFSMMYFGDQEEHEKDFIILGTPFLQSLYSVFDMDNETISFAIREDWG